MKERSELIEEQILRENIRKIVNTVKNKRSEQELLEEQTLRKVVRKLLIEKAAVGDDMRKPALMLSAKLLRRSSLRLEMTI